jgi:hypothetical protein
MWSSDEKVLGRIPPSRRSVVRSGALVILPAVLLAGGPAAAQNGARHFVDGTRIALRADNGEWMTRCQGCMAATIQSVITLAPQLSTPNLFATFTVYNTADGRVLLEADNGQVLSRCNGCVRDGTTADFIGVQSASDRSASYSKFELIRLTQRAYALRADNGRYVARCGGCSPGFGHSRSVVTAHAAGSDAAYAQWYVMEMGGEKQHAFTMDEQSQVFRDIPGQLQRLNPVPTDGRIPDTYRVEYLPGYNAVIDHVGGVAQLSDGRRVLSHSTQANRAMVVIEDGQGGSRFLFVGNGGHAGAIQAAGSVIVVPVYGPSGSDLVFIDARDRNAPREMTHLRKPLDGQVNAAGIVFHPGELRHYLITTTVSDYGAATRKPRLYRTSGQSLFDVGTRFSEVGALDSLFTSQGGTQLLVDDTGALYVAALFRTEPSGEEGKPAGQALRLGMEWIALSRLHPNNLTSERPLRYRLYDSGLWLAESPGFRWGGSIGNRGVDLLVIGAHRRLALLPTAPYHPLLVWQQRGR